MIIGILAESSNDSEPLKEIVHKLLPPELQGNIRYIIYESNTGIYADIEKAAKLFFNTEPKCDIAIYLNDLDTQPNRCKKIRKWTRSYCATNVSTQIVVGCPDPTFEQWYINEENAVKRVLSLEATRALPYYGLHPKTRLENMIYDNSNITITKKSAYIEIAKNLNIAVLKDRDLSFSKFHEEFMLATRLIE